MAVIILTAMFLPNLILLLLNSLHNSKKETVKNNCNEIFTVYISKSYTIIGTIIAGFILLFTILFTLLS